MSVKELVLKDEIGNSITLKHVEYGGLRFNIKDLNGEKGGYLDRNQAHLLMLYLQDAIDAWMNYCGK